MNNPNTTAPKRPLYKRKGFWITVGAVLAVGAISNAVQGNPDAGDRKEAAPAVTVTKTASPAPAKTTATPKAAPTTPDASEAAAETASGKVPDVVGMTNEEAIPALHKAGFMANEEDATGNGRWALDNSNWKVCRQAPAPGYHPATLRVAIYSVKLDESC